MKKFFAFVAAALVAFSFTACEGAGGGGSNFFKITVSNVTETAADIEIVPADTTAYYAETVFLASDFAKAGVDSLSAAYVADLAALAEAYGAQTLIQYHYILQGKLSSPLEGLNANTEYTILALELNVNGDVVTLGKNITHKTFKTKDIEVKSEVNMGELVGGGFEDYRDFDGSYYAYATDEATYEVLLNIFDDDCVGNFTAADLDPEYSYVWTSDMGENPVTIAKAQLESKLTGENIATISGWVIGSNSIKYKFSFSHPTVEAAGAPKKAAKKANELKPATLKVRK